MSVENKHISFAKRSKYSALLLGKNLPELVSEDFNTVSKSIIENPSHLIVCYPDGNGFSKEWTQAFRFLSDQLGVANKKVCFTHTTQQASEFIENSTDGPKLRTYPTLDEALSELFANQKPVDKMHYIKVFVTCTQRTLYVQAQVKCTQEKIFILDSAQTDKLLGDVSGLILVEGKNLAYVVLISFPEQTFLKIMSKLLGQEFTVMTPEITDGVTELMNIIYGQAKLVLDVKNAGIQSNIPSLVIGKKIPTDTEDPRLLKSNALLESGKTVVIPFDTPVGKFYVQVCFTEQFVKELNGASDS